MTWTLKSGRDLYGFTPNDVTPGPGSQVFDGNGNLVQLDTRSVGDWEFEGEFVASPEERREIAEAVKAAWDRWAETGEP